MKRNFKYCLALSATLALSFCQGRHSSVFDPMQGKNAMTAQQLVNTPVDNRALPFGSDRPQRYSFNFTYEQEQACGKLLYSGEPVPDICAQILYQTYYGNLGAGFDNFTPDNTQMYFSNGTTADVDWRGIFKDRPWIPQMQQSMGGANYQTPMNMRRFCQDPSQFTTIRFSTPCGKMNWSEARINVGNNRGFNYMRQGDFRSAEPYFGPQGLLQRRNPQMYGTVLSRRDIGKENKERAKEVEKSWGNLKQMPKNVGLGIVNQAMNLVGSKFAQVGGRVEAGLSNAATGGWIDAANSQQVINNNDYVANMYYDMTRASEYSTISAMQPDNPCPPDKYYYKIGNEPATDNQYHVIDCGH